MSKYEHVTIDDLILPGLGEHKDRTTQIDTVLISRKGVFVIETKDYKAHISGNDYDEYWTLTYNNGNSKIQYSPVRQNDGHIYRIRGILKQNNISLKKIPFYNFVVFRHGDLLGVDSEYCFYLNDELKDTILNLEDCISIEDVKTISTILNYYKVNNKYTHKHHSDYVHQIEKNKNINKD